MYEEIIKEASKKYGVSEKLITEVIRAESSFNAGAVSPAGAQGLMQLMPATAKSLGVTDPFDPRQNIMGGAKYLADCIRQNNASVPLALAVYNAGQGSVDKYGGIPPYAETQNYVKKIMVALGGKDDSTGKYADQIVDSMSGNSSANPAIDVKWWGDIVIVSFTVITILIGFLFLISAFSGEKFSKIKLGGVEKLAS